MPAGAGLAVIRRGGARLAGTCLAASFLFICNNALSWERGNHAGDWARGQTVRVCVDPPPGDPDQQAQYYAAVDEAMAEWNDAQSEFGGLTLERADTDCDVTIHWQDNYDAWGRTFNGYPVDVTIESDDGLNSRGVTRVLKHEFGHVEGLKHSAKSALMREDAYSSNPGHAPSAEDLNSADPFTAPTEDDKAGKKEMFGTVEEESKSDANGNAVYDDVNGYWRYDWSLLAFQGPTYVDPVTEFTIDLPPGVGESDFNVTVMPSGWVWNYYFQNVTSGKPLDVDAGPSPALLSFTATSPEYGIFPGGNANFQITSPLGPVETRAFTNSPSYDSDESMVVAPAPSEVGWAVNATNPVVLADDWIATQTGVITDIRFWGSWRNGIEGQITSFNLTIQADRPVGDPQNDRCFSAPGDTLWTFEAVDFLTISENPALSEGWFDPDANEVIPDDHQDYFQYIVFLPEQFRFPQEEGIIYWLGISANVVDPDGTMWGWESSFDHWNDDAVWANSQSILWTDLLEPIYEFRPGDVDGDRDIDFADFQYLSNWLGGSSDPPPYICPGSDPPLYGAADVTGDCLVNIPDLVALSNYLQYCNVTFQSCPDCPPGELQSLDLALVINSETTTGIPTLNEWGMLLLALLLVTAGTLAVVRRRRKLLSVT